MAVLSADEYPGAEKQPLSYPGDRPDFSYVYSQGKIYEITFGADAGGALWVAGNSTLDDFLAARGNAPLAGRHAVLAVGSNGCPGRLAEKFARQPEAAIPVFVGTLADTAVVYSRRVTRYGALPAAYLHQPGATSWLSLTMLDEVQLARMDETEGAGKVYDRVAVEGIFRVDGGPEIGGLSVYVDRKILAYQGKPVRLRLPAREGPDWPALDEREVLALAFDEAGLLMGEPIETRHKRLMADASIRRQLAAFLETEMGKLAVDARGRLVDG